MLPLLLRAAREGKLALDDIVRMTHHNPRRILGLPTKNPAIISVSPEEYEFGPDDVRSRCSWSPYVGRLVTGRVWSVQLNGEDVYLAGRIVSRPAGQILKPSS